MTPSFLFSFAALGLLAGLVALVLAKRLARAAAERRSRSRRDRWQSALGSGPVRELRMKEIRALARGAARGRRGQEDLLALISAGRLPPEDDRHAPFRRALRRAGLQGALRRACESRDAVKRGRAALIWAGLGLPGGERVIARLAADRDPDVRAAAVQALAGCASEEAAWALIEAMRSAHLPPERCAERLNGAWAVAPLLSALRDPGFHSVRPWLAEALGLTGDRRAVLPLIRLLADGDESQRIRASRALGRLGDESASDVLVKALADPSAAVRAQAARALADLRDERSVYALVQLLGDRSWWVRARAGEALRALGAPGVAALRWCAETHADPYARERALEALAHALAEAETAPEPAAASRAVVA
jgi:HEAT repeat protein/PBS lyase HEAT-like repeat-containing protein